MTVRLLTGDCREIMAAMEPNSVDAIVTDPPYGLEFMGKEWDRLASKPRGKTSASAVDEPTIEDRDDTPQHRSAVRQPAYLLRCDACGGNSSGAWNRCQCESPSFRSRSDLAHGMQSWHESWAREAYRVLKPGGHIVAFGGTRTHHRLMCAIEDSGFEIRDTIGFLGILGWVTGQGFPKSLNVSKDARFCQCMPDLRTEPSAQTTESAVEVLLPDVCRQGEAGVPATEDLHGMRHAVEAKEPLSGDAQQDVLRGVPSQTTEPNPDGSAVCAQGETGASLPHLWQGAREACGVGEADEAELLLPTVLLGVEAERSRDSRETPGELEQRQGQEAAGQGVGGREESSLEGRGDVLPQARQLQADQVRPVSTGLPADGPQGRLRDGTSTDSGQDVSAMPVAPGSSASSGSRPAQQRADELPRLPDEHRAQTCGRCGKPIIPQGLGTSLKPSYEPIVLARKPLIGTVVNNWLAHGTGALNIDGCRIGWQPEDLDPKTNRSITPNAGLSAEGFEATDGRFLSQIDTKRVPFVERMSSVGRWPANVVLGHSPECREVGVKRVKGARSGGYEHRPVHDAWRDIEGRTDRPLSAGEDVRPYIDPDGYETVTDWECAPDCAVALLDAQAGERTTHGGGKAPKTATANVFGTYGQMDRDPRFKGDTGGASRYFLNVAPDDELRFRYTPKASRAERNSGLGSTCTVKYTFSNKERDLCEATAQLLEKATSDIPTVRWHIGESGASITARCPLDSLSTTLTEIKRITPSTILNWSMLSLTSDYTADVSCETANGGSPVESAASSNPSSLSTTSERQALVLGAVGAASSMLSKISDGEEWKPDTNFHPTCKPVSLMRWLVRLVTPPGGTVLDPFCGSGSTGIAAVLEGFDFIGVEESAEYVGIARRRIAHAEQHGENWLKGAKAAYGGPRRYGGGKDMGDTVRRCPEHGESFPSGSNSYRCGCPVVRVPDPIATEASDPTLDYGPLFAAIEPTR